MDWSARPAIEPATWHTEVMTTFVLFCCVLGLLLVWLGRISRPARERVPVRQWSLQDWGRHAWLGLRFLGGAGTERADRLERLVDNERRRHRGQDHHREQDH